MATVTIDSVEYPVYGNVAAADAYLGGSMTADAWRAADATTKARALVSATRWIDGQQWQGEKTSAEQDLMWPRAGIDGIESANVPAAIVNASFELAAGFAGDAEFATSFAATQAKRIKAGSVEIENFRGGAVQVTTVFPPSVMRLIGQWLASTGGAFAGARSYGTCRESTLDRDYDRGFCAR